MNRFLQSLRNLQVVLRRPLAEWDSWALAILGATTFCIAGYWGLTIKAVIGELIHATNDAGITLMALVLWGLVGMRGVVIWVFGCIAARCHLVLFARHF